MANEINNISHAGIVCFLQEDPDAPIIQGSWGIDEAAGFTRQTTLQDGYYTIPLMRPIGARTGPDVDGSPPIISDVGAVTLSSFFNDQTNGDGMNAGLLSSLQLVAALPFDADIQLDLLVISLITNAGAATDGVGLAQVEVRRIPTQD